MKYYGLFIGIDRYADPAINWLAGASRDAAVLHALFNDNFGDNAELLLDEAAAGKPILDALDHLKRSCTAKDIVVVFYAGHGSVDHRLVPYDANTADIESTCLSLDDLADALSAIDARQMICILDCCFSGGLGARVLASGVRPRNMISASVDAKLARLVGSGRVVLTASAADEEALESSRHGHGLLTFRLLEALQGIGEVREADQLNWLKVIDYVVRLVIADAQQMGHQQTPTLRGQIDGSQLWPVLEPGERFKALVPSSSRPPVDDRLDSLKSFGLPEEIIDVWSQAIPTLNDLQKSAVNDYGILDGESLVVTAPTSSGKTMIGELAALLAAAQRRRSIFLLPMRALVNDKYAQFERQYGPAGIKTIRATGEHSDDVPALLAGRFDIALLTYEKFSALALGYPHLLDIAATVVVDEAQILADNNRGSNLEFVLTMLNNRRGATGSPQIVTLSAVVGDLKGLDHWLGARHLHSDDRPVPLIEGVVDFNGNYRYVDESGTEQQSADFIKPLPDHRSRSLLIPLVERLVGENKKVLVFRQSRGEARACALYLADALQLEAATDAISDLPEDDPSTSSSPLRTALAHGVAFHSADLGREERLTVEEHFRDSKSPLRVVVATPTLAMGVNTPAGAVVIVGLTHPFPATPYTVAEYKNMVGRAGRLGITDRGESYLLPEGQLDPERGWRSYVHGSLEDLDSQLVPDGDPRSLMLRVLASTPTDAVGAVSEEDVISFLDSSFAAHQARAGGSQQWTRDGLEHGFRELVEASLITLVKDKYQLTSLGRFSGEAGVHVDSILRLVHVLRGVTTVTSDLLVAAAQVTAELDEVYMPVNARARNSEVPRWPNLLFNQGVPRDLLQRLQLTAQDARQAVSRHKKAAAASMWMNGVPTHDIETALTRHLPQTGGVAGNVRGCADRTRDLLPAVGAVLHELGVEVPEGLMDRTSLRLELGIRAEVAQLAADLDVTLDRSQWNALADAQTTTVEQIVASEPGVLEGFIGAAAEKLREAAVDHETEAQAGIPSMPPVVE